MYKQERPYKKISLNGIDTLLIIKCINELEYYSKVDFTINYGLFGLPNLDVSIVIYSEKMLQDTRVKEIFLEHLI